MRAVASDDPEHGPRWAMPRITRPAQIAYSAARIDLTDHTLPYQLIPISALHDPDKLVPRCPPKSRIPFHQLQVRPANPRLDHTHHRLAIRRRQSHLGNPQLTAINTQRF